MMEDEKKKKNIANAGVETGADIATDVALYSAISGVGKSSSAVDVSENAVDTITDAQEVASDIADEAGDVLLEATSEGGNTVIEAIGDFIGGIFD